MPPGPCPHCGRAASGSTDPCPDCEAAPRQFATTGKPRRKFLQPADTATAVLWVAQVLAILVILAFAAGSYAAQRATVDAPGGEVAAARASGEAIGYALATVFGPLLFSALALGWSRRTRRHILFLAVGFLIVGTAGRGTTGSTGADDAALERELSRTRAIVGALTDSAGNKLGESAPSVPSGSQIARLVWAINRAYAEIPAHTAEVAQRHGIDLERMPAAWGTTRYAANASAHPQVEQYWLGYRATLTDLRDGFSSWLEARVTAHARQADVSSTTLQRYVEGLHRGARSTQGEAAAWADSVATAALAYHRFLASVDARVSYDPQRDMATFARTADLERANLLQARLQTAVDRLTAAQEVARRGSLRQIDSVAKKVI